MANKEDRIKMSLRDIVNLGGEKVSKDVMTSKVMIATGDTKTVEFADKLWELIVETDYLRPAVHGVLVKGLTHKEASETFDVRESYLRNLIGREGSRLAEDLGVDVVPYLTGAKEFSIQAEVEALNSVVESLLQESNKLEEDLFDKLTFDIGNKRSVRTSHLSDSDFIKVVQELEFISKTKMESKLEDVGDTNIGYIVYLLRTDDKYLTKSDITKKEIIKEVWWL